jgi:competence protein ComEC
LDVGQGTAVVVQVADRVLVYDTGPTGTSGMDSGARVLVPWLQSQGIGHLDAVVISHQDDDHVGGAQSLLAAMSPDWLASSLPTDHAVLGGVGRHYPCRRGEHWQWGGAKFEWLHPSRVRDPGRGSPTNAVSCVLRIQSPAGTVLLTGDIEAAQERQLVALDGPAKLRAEVLVVPHHGSKTSSTEAFLDAVNPRWAVFQAAYRSRYGHPHPSVWARYQHRGITLLRSDADGAITVRLSPHAEVQVVRSRHDPRRYWRVPVVFAR